MEIGFCAGPERMQEVAAAGFDYIELPVTRIATLSEAEFCRLRDEAARMKLPCPSFNVLFPGEISLLSSAQSEAEIVGYLDHAMQRLQRLGGKVCVFGSGRSRMRPEALPYDEAFRQLVNVTRMIGGAAARHELTIAVEPLNRRETNMINSLAESAALTAAVHHPAVRFLADYYHVAVEHEPPEDVARLGGIAHCHIAAEADRTIPVAAEDGFIRLFRSMKASGYAGRISIEGRADDLPSQGPAAISLLKRLWAEA